MSGLNVASPFRQAPPARGDDGEARSARILLLIDDVRLRRECLFHLLSAELPDFEVLAVATTQPFETWAVASPDVILVGEPRAAGDRSRIGEIVAAAKGAPVLVLVEPEGDDRAPATNEPGVAGRFPSACGTKVLIAAIELALAGGRFEIPARPPAVAAPRPG